MTPLHWAAEKGHIQVAEYLLGRGAIANNRNKVSYLIIEQWPTIGATANEVSYISIFH